MFIVISVAYGVLKLNFCNNVCYSGDHAFSLEDGVHFSQLLLDVVQGAIHLVHGPGRLVWVVMGLLPDVLEFFCGVGNTNWVSISLGVGVGLGFRLRIVILRAISLS